MSPAVGYRNTNSENTLIHMLVVSGDAASRSNRPPCSNIKGKMVTLYLRDGFYGREPGLLVSVIVMYMVACHVH